jgi:hypothetical protein
MATYTKFQAFVEHLAEGVHNFSSDATCTITVALCNAANAPSVSADAVLADIVQIAYTNLSARVVSVASSAHTTGTYKLTVNDLTLTASGGSVAPFRYVVLYNDDPTSPADPLICFFDYGSDLTLNSGESLLLNFDGAAGLFTIA